MENLKEGRVTINDQGKDFEIVVPAPRNWFVVFFSFYFSLFTLAGIIAPIYIVIFESEQIELLLITVICAILFLLFFKILYWNLFGKDILKFDQEFLTIVKKNAILEPTLYCDLSRKMEFWVEMEILAFAEFFPIKRKYLSIGSFGPVRFSHMNKVFKYGAVLTEREANFIVSFIKKRRILALSNLEQN